MDEPLLSVLDRAAEAVRTRAVEEIHFRIPDSEARSGVVSSQHDMLDTRRQKLSIEHLHLDPLERVGLGVAVVAVSSNRGDSTQGLDDLRVSQVSRRHRSGEQRSGQRGCRQNLPSHRDDPPLRRRRASRADELDPFGGASRHNAITATKPGFVVGVDLDDSAPDDRNENSDLPSEQQIVLLVVGLIGRARRVEEVDPTTGVKRLGQTDFLFLRRRHRSGTESKQRGSSRDDDFLHMNGPPFAAIFARAHRCALRLTPGQILSQDRPFVKPPYSLAKKA